MQFPMADRRRLSQQAAVQSNTIPLPAPIGGWNARDSLAGMPPEDAIALENWLPEADRVTVRPGCQAFATGVGTGDVETVTSWRGASGSKLIAAGGGELYDATSAGAASVISSSAGYTSNRWQTANFKGRLFGFNGEDAPWDYTGSALTSTNWTGVTKANLIQADVFKTRLMMVEKDSASFWYPAAGAVTGAVNEFDLSQIARDGGTLQAVGTWTLDAGDGLDDLLVCVMSTGEIITYQGTNPGDASAWSKVGSYYTAPPIGRRCLTKLGGDLIVLTEAGYLPVSLIAQGWTIDRIIQDTAWGKIAPAVKQEAANYRSNWGWQASALLPSGKLYFNVPVSASKFETHALNTETGAWGKIIGLNARTWAAYNAETYFGGAGGVVYKHTGNSDSGSDIVADARQAFTHAGAPAQRKRATWFRPYLASRGSITTARVGLEIDYRHRSGNLHTVELTKTEGTPWGSPWGSPWGVEFGILRKRVGLGGIGRALSTRLEITAGERVDWYSSELTVEMGGA